QSLDESLAQPTLAAEPLRARSIEEAIRRPVVGPERVHGGLFRVEPLGIAPELVEMQERLAESLELEVRHLALQSLELDRIHAGRLAAEIEDLVDLVEVEGVVQNHLVGGVLG